MSYPALARLERAYSKSWFDRPFALANTANASPIGQHSSSERDYLLRFLRFLRILYGGFWNSK
jgi:hypothetical protein